MARNSGKGSRIGSVRGKTQLEHPSGKGTVKRDAETGRFEKYSKTGFKGTANEEDGRRS